MRMMNVLSGIVDLIAPPVCPLCGKDVYHGKGHLCDDCEAHMPMLPERVCRCCGGPNDGMLDLCRNCMKVKGGRPWRHAVSAFPFFGEVRTAVHMFKYRNAAYFAPYLGRRMYEAWQKNGDEFSPELVTYIPLHWIRYWRRGYNQAELLATELASYLGIPVQKTLSRKRHTGQQAMLSSGKRQKNMHGAFSPWHQDRYLAKRILLVDDVLTTGSTLAEATNVLLDSGASEVYVATVARDL